MIRLRGNIFLLLLLRAGCAELSSHPEYGESNNGITRPNMLADLIRFTDPDYDPPKLKTLGEYFSKYLNGTKPTSPQYFPFSGAKYRNGLSMRLEDDYPAVLKEMDRFCHKYLSMTDTDNKLLVGGLVDAIIADDSIEGIFDTGYEKVDKRGLEGKDKFMLQPFLICIWNNILLNHPDASEGKNTYAAWTQAAGYNSPQDITSDIGAERARRITVETSLPDTFAVEMKTDTDRTDRDASEESPYDNADETDAADSTEENIPKIDIYETVEENPLSGEKYTAHFRTEAHDNGIAIGQLYGGLHITRGGSNE